MQTGLHNTDPATLVRFTERQVLGIVRDSEECRDRFWAKVSRGAGCWLWRANSVGGNHGAAYGQFTVTIAPRRQAHVYAHRVAWALSHGIIPEGAEIMHSCDTPLCVNPAHLSLGTRLANMRDAAEKGRLHVPRPKGQKLTTDQLADIDDLLARGVTQAAVARQFGVSKVWVSLYARGLRRQYDAPSHRGRKAVA